MSVTVTVTIMMRQAKGCCCHFKINNAINNSTITSFSFSHTHTSSSSAAPIASAGPSSTLSLSLRRRKPLFVSSSAASMSSLSYAKELLAAKKAVSLAARLCQKVQRALLQSDVQSKSDKSPVTVADYGSQAVISLVLQKELPSVPFSLVAEEDSGDLRNDSAQDIRARITELVNDTLSTDGSFSTLSVEQVLKAIDCGISEGGSTGRHWVLDPIDGTKGFVRGDQYAIALALLDEGKVVLGVLGCPNLPLTSIANAKQQPSPGEVGCLFFATVGAGTYMQSLEGDLPLQVSMLYNHIHVPYCSTQVSYSSHMVTISLAMQKLGVKAPPVRIDSQAKYGALSRGDGAIYMRFPHKGYREKIWDHAAGCIVVTEAGGLVCDAAGNALDFSKGRYLDLDTGIISTNPKLMPLLLKAVSESKDSSSSTSSM
ncbi:SAL1 phosphatase [Linum perenne]